MTAPPPRRRHACVGGDRRRSAIPPAARPARSRSGAATNAPRPACRSRRRWRRRHTPAPGCQVAHLHATAVPAGPTRRRSASTAPPPAPPRRSAPRKACNASSSPCTTAARISGGTEAAAATTPHSASSRAATPGRRPGGRAVRRGTTSRAASRWSRASTCRGAVRHGRPGRQVSALAPQRTLDHRVGDRPGAYLRQVEAAACPAPRWRPPSAAPPRPPPHRLAGAGPVAHRGVHG